MQLLIFLVASDKRKIESVKSAVTGFYTSIYILHVKVSVTSTYNYATSL